MSVTTSIESGAFTVHLGGLDAMWCLAKDVIVPLAAITDVRIAAWPEVRAGLGWRVGGAYWPGWIATGHYLAGPIGGERQFLAVHRERARLVLIDTELPSRRRVVLQVSDPEHLVAELRAAAGLTP